jgi:hypothetical protein
LIEIKSAEFVCSYLNSSMLGQEPPRSPEELLRACERAQDLGDDFPTVWNTLLRRCPLVIGLPSHEVSDGEARIVVRLITGQKLLSAAHGFSLA